MVDSRTSIGANYSYSRTSYEFQSTTNAVRDSDSQALFMSLSHRFKPLVTIQADLGAQLAGFGGGSSEALALPERRGHVHNFGANSISLPRGASYNIQISEVASFRSSDVLNLYVNFSHHFTPKFSTLHGL